MIALEQVDGFFAGLGYGFSLYSSSKWSKVLVQDSQLLLSSR